MIFSVGAVLYNMIKYLLKIYSHRKIWFFTIFTIHIILFLSTKLYYLHYQSLIKNFNIKYKNYEHIHIKFITLFNYKSMEKQVHNKKN